MIDDNEIQLEGLSLQQQRVADELWACDSDEDVAAVIEKHGTIAKTIKQLMILACLDQDFDKGNDYA